MATDVERLVVQLSADVKKYENALNKAMGQTNKQARRIESRFQKMNNNISGSFTAVGRGMAVAFAAAGGARGAQSLIDSATRIDNALKVAGLSGQDLEAVYEKLYQSATKNAAPIESLVELYGRLALVQKELGISGTELEGFTNSVAVALRVSGKSAAESSGALLQLSQALGSGIVRAEEFNSILEGALPIAQAAAAGLEEAGGSVAKLRQLVVDGRISSEAFFRAFEAGAPMLEQKVAGAVFTVEQQFSNFRTELVDVAREFNKTTDVGEAAGEALSDLLTVVRDLASGMEYAAGVLNSYSGSLGNLGEAAWNAGAALRELLGLPNLGEKLGINKLFGTDVTQATPGNIADRLNGAFGGAAKGDRPKPAADIELSPVSINDFAAPDGKGAGGGKSTKERADEYERLSKRIAESTANIRAETEAQAGLNPLVEDYGYTLEKARATQELMNAALSAGKTITPELEAQIDTLAEGYANATAEAGRLAESQDKIRERAEEMRDFQKDLTRGIVDGFLEGRDAAEIFADALKKVGDRLLDMAFDGLFGGGTFGGAGGGKGLFGGAIIPGILHSGGVAGSDGYGHRRAVSPSVFAGATRYHTGGIAGLKPGEVPAILQRGEVVLPRGSGVNSSAGGIHVTFAPVIDNRGASVEAVARTQQQLDKLKAELPAHVTQAVRSAQSRNVKLG